MAPRKGTKKKSATKIVESVDAVVVNNGEKEEFATDIKNLANGTSINSADDATDSLKLKGTKRNVGRVKNVAPVLEVEAPSKKPASKGKGKKKSSENEVIEKETNHEQSESQEVEENAIEVKTKPKARGSGKKAENKKSANAKPNKDESISESLKEESTNDQIEEIQVSENNTKPTSGRKRKQEILPKAEQQIEPKAEIEEELVEEKASKKISKNSKKTEVVTAEIETQKKKGRGTKKEKLAEKDGVDLTAFGDVEVDVVKEKKPIKRGRATSKKEETRDINGDTEAVIPKKRSRNLASAEKEILKAKPKKERSKKINNEEEKIMEEDGEIEEVKEAETAVNGQTKQNKTKQKKESPSANKKAEKETESEPEPAAPALTAVTKGGRKRAAPSTLNKKAAKANGNDDIKLDDGVDNTELEDEADDSKPSKTKKGKTDAALVNATATNYNKADFDLPPPSDGQTVEEPRYNLKISSWNVAGLRSWVKKDGLKFLDFEQPDIFCMQETKCSNDQLPEEVVRIPGYHPYWLCMPGGYAGVAIYSKIMPINVDYGIGNKDFDDNGRIITAEYEKFFLINVYVPNSGRKLVNLEARMRWEKLFQQFVQNLDARKPVVICGDMNVSHQEQDLANPKTNTRSAGFTKEERDKLTDLLALGYIDTFRHLYPERKGAYTYWTYMANARSRNVGWRLDYFIVSERFIKRIVDNCIRSQCMGSDHCPITLFLNM